MKQRNNLIPVNDLYPCIQGEGVNAGVSMVLLRLHGCAVGCPFCDTKETWDFLPGGEKLDLDDVLGANPFYSWQAPSALNLHIHTYYPMFKWVLVTGGEPAQYDLRGLVNALHDGGLKVALETSGTELGFIGTPFDWVCISPKLNMHRPFLPDTLAHADEIKMVIGKQADLDRLDALLCHSTIKANATVCLQPMSQSKRATALCIETVQQRGWRLSLQLHKYLDQR